HGASPVAALSAGLALHVTEGAASVAVGTAGALRLTLARRRLPRYNPATMRWSWEATLLGSGANESAVA
ncbi:MAG TPA: hypothetical protein VHD91_04400, partial [Gaiellaceae bacterium]|nr:hypothetical protein [Gaiellaceae bacterium]